MSNKFSAPTSAAPALIDRQLHLGNEPSKARTTVSAESANQLDSMRLRLRVGLDWTGEQLEPSAIDQSRDLQLGNFSF